MGSRPAISVAIISLNEEKAIGRCLASTRPLAHHLDLDIIVVDSGSTDHTIDLAKAADARVLHHDWPGHRDQKNFALDQCQHDWVLALDCDEELSPALAESILQFFANGDHERHPGASMNRKVWFLGRWITHGDWYPDTKVRLFRRSLARWGGSHEHDKIELEGDSVHLTGDLHHYSFPDSNRYIEKINIFSDAYLKRELEKGRPWSLLHTLFRPLWRFFRAYILRRGFLDGFPGLWIATATAFQTFVRHSRTFEHQQPSLPPEL